MRFRRLARSSIGSGRAFRALPRLYGRGMRQRELATGVVTTGGGCTGAWCVGCGYQLSTASITKNPITYATATCHTPRTQAIASLPWGHMLDRQRPADQTNQHV